MGRHSKTQTLSQRLRSAVVDFAVYGAFAVTLATTFVLVFE